MQHWNKIIIGIVALFLIVSCAVTKPAEELPESVSDIPATEPRSVQETPADEIKEEPITEEDPAVAAPEPVAKEKEEFQIFNPVLTYAGTYNGPLYATSEQIGGGYPIDKYMDNLDRNGVNWFIGFFTIDDEADEVVLYSHEDIGYIVTAVQKYPHRIVPYFNPGMGGEEVEPLVGDKLTALYRKSLRNAKNLVGSEFIQGIGEIETQEWSVAHNSPQVSQLFELAKFNGISAMFHPVAEKIKQVAQIAEAYPGINFIIHMYRSDLDESEAELIKILQTHDNIYFSIDAAHIAHKNNQDILYDLEKSDIEQSKSSFISTFDSDYKIMLDDAVSDYKPLVEGAPDKVMWGTEAGPDYSFEPEIYDRLIKISRELIGKMPAEHQEAFGYKNALRAFGQGVVLDKKIPIIDTSLLQKCTNTQVDECDKSCEIPDLDILTSEQSTCFTKCLIGKQCINPES